MVSNRVALLGVLLLVACGSSDASPRGSLGENGSGGSFTASGGSSNAGPGANAGNGGRPPEVENESSYLAPVATGKYLWSANPLSGRVALIDAETLSVKLQVAGNHPTTVLGLEGDGQFGALVLNDLSNDATLLRIGDDGEPQRVRSY